MFAISIFERIVCPSTMKTAGLITMTHYGYKSMEMNFIIIKITVNGAMRA